MRDPADNITGTLPGVQPAPVRLSKAQRLSLAGYEGPKERWGCGNCKHGAAAGDKVRCELHGAETRRGGCCRKWEAAR